jgi:hypothetical protein
MMRNCQYLEIGCDDSKQDAKWELLHPNAANIGLGFNRVSVGRFTENTEIALKLC